MTGGGLLMTSENEMNNKQPNIILTSQEILQKDFKKQMRGYDQNEVDEFLDNVIKDYETFNNEIDRLKSENERLLTKIDELTKRLNVNNNGQNVAPQTNAATNYDILKRLSNLERHVFGAKLNNNATTSTPINPSSYRTVTPTSTVDIPQRPTVPNNSVNSTVSKPSQNDFEQDFNRF